MTVRSSTTDGGNIPPKISDPVPSLPSLADYIGSPVSINPEDPTVKRIMAAHYETHDYVNNLNQRIMALEATIEAFRGEIDTVAKMLAFVSPEKLAAVAESIQNSPKERVKRALKKLLD